MSSREIAAHAIDLSSFFLQNYVIGKARQSKKFGGTHCQSMEHVRTYNSPPSDSLLFVYLSTCTFLTICSSGLTVHSLPYQGILLPSIAHNPMANAFKGTAYPFRIAKESSIHTPKNCYSLLIRPPRPSTGPFFFLFLSSSLTCVLS